MSGKRVVIIGAGFAGLAAGWWLANHGFSVKILEARDRVGGRVKTLDLNGSLIEAGAELIGRNHPLWLQFAQQFGLELSLITAEDNYWYERLNSPFFFNGRSLGRNEQIRLFHEMELALITLNADAATVDPDMPWNAARAEEWDSDTVADWINRVGFGADVKAALRFELENNQGAPVAQQSYLGLLATIHGGALSDLSRLKRRPSEFWTESEVFRCASGNQQLANSLETAINTSGADNKTVLSTPAKRVDVHSSGINVIAKDDESYAGEWLVVAVPPSCWHTIGLPTEFSNPPISMGPAIKYLSYVRERFWVRKGLAPSGTDDSLGMIWEGTDNQNLSVDRLPELSLFAGGPAADRALKSAKVDDYFSNALETIYPGFREQRTQSKFEDWPNEEWTQGGYSCPSPTQVTKIARRLYEPTGRIVWAGEHASMAFFGYMEGALQSGIHAAQTIARCEHVPEVERIWDERMSQNDSRKDGDRGA